MEMDALRRRNAELEREVREVRAREECTRRELERAGERLRLTEDAEELLCAQLAELEAEAVALARHYHLRIAALAEQLAAAHSLRDGPAS